jgi:hypothetical protein
VVRRLLLIRGMGTPQPFHRNSQDEDRVLITAVDGFQGHVRAHFNPKEIQFEKTVGWQSHKTTGSNEPYFEYTAGEPRTMSMELLFDSFELKGVTIENELQILARMSLAMNPVGKPEERRPPLLEITNGPIPQFRCVLESLAVKVTMFDRTMRPVRATVNVKFKELRRGDDGKLRPNNAGGAVSARGGLNWTKADDPRRGG